LLFAGSAGGPIDDGDKEILPSLDAETLAGDVFAQDVHEADVFGCLKESGLEAEGAVIGLLWFLRTAYLCVNVFGCARSL